MCARVGVARGITDLALARGCCAPDSVGRHGGEGVRVDGIGGWEERKRRTLEREEVNEMNWHMSQGFE